MRVSHDTERLVRITSNAKCQQGIAFLFLMSIMLLNLVRGVVPVAFFYMTAVLAGYIGVVPNGREIWLPWSAVVLAVLIALTGVINVIFVGNSTINKQLFTIVSIGIALLFLQDDMNSNVFLACLLINALVVLVHIVLYGPRENIYISSTVNYVSVHLLHPTALYYTAREMQHKKVRIWPAGLVWIVALTVQGRSGILVCSMLFFGLIALEVSRKLANAERKKHIKAGVGILSALLIVIILAVKLDVVHRVGIFSRFAEYGLGGNGRGPIWKEYLDAVFYSVQSFVLAPDLTELIRAVHHNGNLHNSFMNIHAYNGIVMFVIVVWSCVKAAIYGIRNRKWCYLIGFAAVCMRGATDYVFWGSSGTPFFFYFLLLPTVEQKHNYFVVEIKTVYQKMKESLVRIKRNVQ